MMMVTPMIRPATEEDLPAIQALTKRANDRRQRAFLGDQNADRSMSDTIMEDDITLHLPHCKVILTNDLIVGFIIYFDNLIHLMIIDPDLQREGLGSCLLEYAEAQLFDQGNSIIRLETYEDNRQAMNFYRKNGWTVTKKEKGTTGKVRVFFDKTKH
ncbi:MAG: GNAT family N-acetyltransferase [Anaerolineae bacterium]|jgi:ribosomal protein S18 acetylase RimI-like enzyme|nr:GNAT family N-acetyltransferase [Anaerolineae bacterium]